jgi:hypothetical protein
MGVHEHQPSLEALGGEVVDQGLCGGGAPTGCLMAGKDRYELGLEQGGEVVLVHEIPSERATRW